MNDKTYTTNRVNLIDIPSQKITEIEEQNKKIEELEKKLNKLIDIVEMLSNTNEYFEEYINKNKKNIDRNTQVIKKYFFNKNSKKNSSKGKKRFLFF